jgi:hypothetical protein
LEINPDAVFVLSGGIIGSPNVQDGQPLRSTPYTEVDHVGLFGGGEARVIAAAELSTLLPDALIVTNSTVLSKGGKVEEHALVYAAELRAMGVPDGRIREQTRSSSTATELVELLRLIKGEGWSRVVVITNDYHIPRVKAMYDNLERLFTPEYDEALSREVAELVAYVKENSIQIVLQDAESILISTRPSYAPLIADSKLTEAYQKRLLAEKEGIRALLSGEYKLTR